MCALDVSSCLMLGCFPWVCVSVLSDTCCVIVCEDLRVVFVRARVKLSGRPSDVGHAWANLIMEFLKLVMCGSWGWF